MFARLFRRLYTARAQARVEESFAAAVKAHIEALNERAHRLEIAHKQLTATVQEHYGQLHKVRGKVYGTAARNGGSGVGQIPFGDKDALRAAVGLTAAKRFQHTEE